MPTGPGHDQRPEGPFQLGAGPRQQRVRVVTRHSQRVRQIITLKFVDQAQLDDIPLARIQPVNRRPDQLPQIRSFGLAADVADGVGTSFASSSAAMTFPARSRRRHSLRATA